MNEFSNPNQNKDSISIQSLLITILKWRKVIFWNTFIVTVAAIIVSLMLDKWYTSTASILPPKKKAGLFGDISGFSSTIKDLSKTLSRLGTTSDEAFNYLAILQSRTASMKVIEKFNLKQVYKIPEDKPYENVIEALKNNVDFNVEDEGNITINVTDKSPQRAADIANYYVDLLNEISIELNTREAKSHREFIEKRFNKLIYDIKAKEDSLKIFSKNYNVYGIEEQVKSIIKTAVDLRSKTEEKKIQLDIYKLSHDETSPLIIQTQLELNELQKKSKELQIGSEIKSSMLFVPFKDIPDVGMNYVRLIRDYEVQNKLLEFLLPIYEQAKIDEQKDIPVVLVLDKAIPAEKKTYPKRMIIVLISFFLSFLLAVGYVFVKESFQNLKSDPIKYERIKTGIFDPLNKFFIRKK
jgi:uncharacterized protein involved in exopolysaccharide biosynthesis